MARKKSPFQTFRDSVLRIEQRVKDARPGADLWTQARASARSDPNEFEAILYRGNTWITGVTIDRGEWQRWTEVQHAEWERLVVERLIVAADNHAMKVEEERAKLEAARNPPQPPDPANSRDCDGWGLF